MYSIRDELIGKQKNRLQGEFAIAKVEKIFQTWPEQVEDHGIVVTFRAKPSNERNADTARKGLVDTSLIFELRVLCFDAFELNSYFFTRDDVRAWRRVSRILVLEAHSIVTYQGICHRNCRSRFCGLCGTCCRLSNP